MKHIYILIILFIGLSCSGQKSSLIGTWQIKKIINNTNSSVGDCLEAAKEYKLTFNSDNTYSFDAGPGYITSGFWKIVGNKINFYNSKLSDPSQGNVADHSFIYKIEKDGTLIIEEYMCSELGGKTYYEKK